MSLRLFEDVVNKRGGLRYGSFVPTQRCHLTRRRVMNKPALCVRAGGELHPLRFVIVSDDSKLEQVTNATAHAIRGHGVSLPENEPRPASNRLQRPHAPRVVRAACHTQAQFMIGGFSSGFTNYAARQSYADGTIMMASTAATPSVISQNNLTFGVLPVRAFIATTPRRPFADRHTSPHRRAAQRKALRPHCRASTGYHNT